MKYVLICFFTIACIFTTANLNAQTTIYQNPEASIDERVEDLLRRMTVYEKIGQMTQLNISMINTTGAASDVVLDEEKARYLIRNHHIGSFINGDAVPPETWFTFIYELSRVGLEESRLEIPVIYGIDHIHGASYLAESTIFPHNINLGATFNPIHAYATGWVTAYESVDIGHRWGFAPTIDLGVNPLWARIWETYGEDPHLASEMGRNFIEGYQGNEEIAPYRVAATGKHFVAYSDPRTGWDRTPVQLSMQAIREFHLPPFQAAVDAGIKTMMLNSGEVNGIPVHASYEFVTELLRDEMGFDGVVLTDWADIEKLVDLHRTAENYKEAVYQAVTAGIDVSMTPLDLNFNTALKELVDEGRITEERLDESVRRILRLKFELGLFEYPFPRSDRLYRIGTEENRLKALEAARESIVLLRNENDVLPAKEPNLIVVAGMSANSKRNLNGGWTLTWAGGTEEQYPEDMHTIYTALQKEYPAAEIRLIASELRSSANRDLLDSADLIIYAGGEEPYAEFTGNVTDLTLPSDQLSDVAFLSESETPLVLVLVLGRPRIITPIVEKTDAIIFTGLPGFEGGEAIANIISGRVNPSGRLPISYPMYTGHFSTYNHKPSAISSSALYPFGHGLSYTEFDYSDLQLGSHSVGMNESLTASVTVTNSGEVTGMESVLWYITNHVGRISRPVLELKHFEKIELEPGESTRLEFELVPQKHISYPDRYGNRILEPGRITVRVGDLSKEFMLVE